MARIQFNIPDDVYRRIKKHPRFPRSQRGSAISRFWAELFLDGSVRSAGFENDELRARLRATESAISSREYLDELTRRRSTLAQADRATGSGAQYGDH